MHRSLLPTTLMIVVSFLLGGERARADLILAINAAGMETAAGYASPLNSQQLFNLSPGAAISDIRWSAVTYEAFDPSFMSEVVFAFSNSDRSQSWHFNISATDAPGIYTGSGGLSDMVVSFGGPFSLKSDGILRMEVYETYTDVEVSPNARISAGTFLVNHAPVVSVPEPSLLCMSSISLALFGWRRRRTSQMA